MEKPNGKCRTLFLFSLFLFWVFFYCFQELVSRDSAAAFSRVDSERYERVERPPSGSQTDPCSDRYVYVHRLPSRFNDDMLKQCSTLSLWTDMCLYTSNAGLGPALQDEGEGVLPRTAWYATDQFSLDVIFTNRMRQYRCLTNDSSRASTLFVPFFAGLDASRYLWGFNVSVRDSAAMDLMQWLSGRPEWKRMGGRDHFLVAGRISWDFRRLTDAEDDWGNKLLLLPEAQNMTTLVIESKPWSSNEFSIPYPTYFHPSTAGDLLSWQRRMRTHRRPWLFSFAGAPRPNMTHSIRGHIIDQCRASNRSRLLDCTSGSCRAPARLMKTFQRSVFCLQPPGDSYTRRSTFDSMVAGCVPVFFHPGSAYVQYRWHLPRNYTEYSVFIPENEVREGRVSIEKLLLEIPEERVKAMREKVVDLIPAILYADPRAGGERMEDAFEIAVTAVIEKVARLREKMRERNFVNSTPDEQDDGTGLDEDHTWDSYFYGPVRTDAS